MRLHCAGDGHFQAVAGEPIPERLCQTISAVLDYVQCLAHIGPRAQPGDIPPEVAGSAAAVGTEREDDLAGQVVFRQP